MFICPTKALQCAPSRTLSVCSSFLLCELFSHFHYTKSMMAFGEHFPFESEIATQYIVRFHSMSVIEIRHRTAKLSNAISLAKNRFYIFLVKHISNTKYFTKLNTLSQEDFSSLSIVFRLFRISMLTELYHFSLTQPTAFMIANFVGINFFFGFFLLSSQINLFLLVVKWLH